MRCRRCGATLARAHALGVNGQLALTLAAALTFLIANVSPIVTLELNGQRIETALHEAIQTTWQTGEHGVALLALATAFGFPLAVVALRLWVLLPLANGRAVPAFVPAMRALRWVTRWSMVEVFMLGTLIAIVRSAGVTQVVAGVGLLAYIALTVLLTGIQSCGLDDLWRRGAEARR